MSPLVMSPRIPRLGMSARGKRNIFKIYSSIWRGWCQPNKWDAEQIPDGSFVLRHVHPRCWIGARPSSGCLSDHELSVDWEKYSTLEQTAKRGGVGHFAVTFSVAYLRGAQIEQDVRHDPINTNRAHSLVIGDKSKDKAAIARSIAQHCQTLPKFMP